MVKKQTALGKLDLTNKGSRGEVGKKKGKADLLGVANTQKLAGDKITMLCMDIITEA